MRAPLLSLVLPYFLKALSIWISDLREEEEKNGGCTTAVNYQFRPRHGQLLYKITIVLLLERHDWVKLRVVCSLFWVWNFFRYKQNYFSIQH